MFQMPYGNEWRAHRRTFHQHFNEQSVKRYETQISRYTAMFLKLLLDTPGQFLGHSRWCAPFFLFLHTFGLLSSDGVLWVFRYAGALILNVVYGFDIRDHGDPHLVAPEKAIAAGNAVVTEGVSLGMFLRFRGYLDNVQVCCQWMRFPCVRTPPLCPNLLTRLVCLQ